MDKATAYSTPLERFNELHQFYNGPVPQALLTVAQLGTPEAVALMAAEGNAVFYKHLVHGQVQAIRARREDHSYYPAMATDLAYYLARWRVAMRHARELRHVIAQYHPQAVAA